MRGEVVGTQNNVATVTDSGTPLVTPNPTDDADVIVDPMADLGVTKSGPANAASGSQIAYTLVTTNNGPDTAAATVVVGSVPSSLTTGSLAGLG